MVLVRVGDFFETLADVVSELARYVVVAATNGKMKVIIMLTAALGVLVGVAATSLIGVYPIHNRLSKVETSIDFMREDIRDLSKTSHEGGE